MTFPIIFQKNDLSSFNLTLIKSVFGEINFLPRFILKFIRKRHKALVQICSLKRLIIPDERDDHSECSYKVKLFPEIKETEGKVEIKFNAFVK